VLISCDGVGRLGDWPANDNSPAAGTASGVGSHNPYLIIVDGVGEANTRGDEEKVIWEPGLHTRYFGRAGNDAVQATGCRKLSEVVDGFG
jgi:hypothetical protein